MCHREHKNKEKHSRAPFSGLLSSHLVARETVFDYFTPAHQKTPKTRSVAAVPMNSNK